MMRMFTIATMMLVGSTAQAQGLGFSSDRPTFRESANVVGQGALVTEIGAAVEKGPRLTTPDATVRLGLLPTLEARLTAPSAVFQNGDVTSTNRIGLGLKLAAGNDLLSVSLVPTFTIPADGVGETQTTLGVNAELSLTDSLMLGGSAQVGAVEAVSADLSLRLGPLGLVAQTFAVRDGGTSAGGALTYALCNFAQLDLGVNAGVTDDAPDVVGRAGFSVLWN